MFLFVNLIRPTSMLSFGPPDEPTISLVPAGAEPCAALFAARLGRSSGRHQRDPAIKKVPLGVSLPGQIHARTANGPSPSGNPG